MKLFKKFKERRLNKKQKQQMTMYVAAVGSLKPKAICSCSHSDDIHIGQTGLCVKCMCNGFYKVVR